MLSYIESRHRHEIAILNLNILFTQMTDFIVDYVFISYETILPIAFCGYENRYFLSEKHTYFGLLKTVAWKIFEHTKT